MTEQPLAAKKRIDDALEALRIALAPYVSQKMESAFGKNWRSYSGGAATDDRGLGLDVHALLKTVRDNWREVFSEEARMRKARPYLYLALEARNNAAHFAGEMEQREALRYLDGILEILRAIGARLQEEVVFKLYSEQQAGVPPFRPTPTRTQIAVRPSASGLPVDRRVAPSQTQADQIRDFALEHYVASARRDGFGEITIRAGDIHREMRLTSAMPAVCSAIGSKRFAEMANVTLAGREGPTNGANVYFRFNLGREVVPKQIGVAASRPVSNRVLTDVPKAPNLNGALILVSCVKSKLTRPAPARILYTSMWFTYARHLVEARGARWFVLSSRYGLVSPDTVIAPYEYSLKSLGVSERKAWATKVLEKLLPESAGFHRVVMLAGARYSEFLIAPLEQQGISVELPMEHLRRGEQLAWLSQHR